MWDYLALRPAFSRGVANMSHMQPHTDPSTARPLNHQGFERARVVEVLTTTFYALRRESKLS